MNELTTLNGCPASKRTEFLLSKIDDFGTPRGLQPLRGRLGARLLCALPWTKQVASHWGGTRNGAIPVHWPNGVSDTGRMRDQFHHVIDVAPPIVEAAGLPRRIRQRYQQAPLEGVSMIATLRDGSAPETHDVQYFEMMGNRGIYLQGWTAVTKHRTPWKADTPPPFDTDVWELYGPDDWTQAITCRRRTRRNSLSCNVFGSSKR